jgi:hypothetical protein
MLFDPQIGLVIGTPHETEIYVRLQKINAN